MFRKYLLSLYRFNQLFGMNIDKSIERSIVIFTITIYFFLVWVESYMGINFIKNKITAILFGLPIVLFVIPLNIWLLKNPPSTKEIDSSKDKYSGIILLLLSAILAAFFRKYYI